MSTIIRKLDGCRSAYPSDTLDNASSFAACARDVIAGRGHFASHIDGIPVWLDPLARLFSGNPGLIAAAVVCAIIWLVLLVKVIGAPNLRAPQKWGWAIGLTFVFPVFSVLYLALLPAEAKRQ